MAYYIPPEWLHHALELNGATYNESPLSQQGMLKDYFGAFGQVKDPTKMDWSLKDGVFTPDPKSSNTLLSAPSSSGKSGFSFNKAQGYIDAITGIAKHATGMVADIRQSAQSQIQDPRFTDYNATGNTLYDLRNVPLHKLSESNLTDVTGAQAAGDFHKKVGTGIMAGAKLGTQIAPGFGTMIGGIIGGVAGGAGSLANTFTKHKRYQRDLAETRRRNQQYTNNYIDTQNEIAYNMNTSMNNLIDRQRNGNIIAEGGKLNDINYSDITTFNAGGTHEQNPNGGIQQGYGDNGKPNLVEEGEVLWNDFVFSNRIKPQKEILAQHNTSMNKDFDTYADMAKYIMELHKERESNPFDKQTLNIQMERLSQAQEYQKIVEEAKENNMTPDEYINYVQHIHNQQTAPQQNVFAQGGDKSQFETRADKQYFKSTPERYEGWYHMEKFLELYDVIRFGGIDGNGKQMTEKEKNDLIWHERYLKNFLATDPYAQIYFRKRFKSLSSADPNFINQTTDELFENWNVPSVKYVKNGGYGGGTYRFEKKNDTDPLKPNYTNNTQSSANVNQTNNDNVSTPQPYVQQQRYTTPVSGIRSSVPRQNANVVWFYDPETRSFTQEKTTYGVPVNFNKSGTNYNGLFVSDPNGWYLTQWNQLLRENPNLKNDFKNWYLSDEYVPTNDINGKIYNKWATPQTSADDLYNEATNNLWGSAHQAFIDFVYNKVKPQPQVVEPDKPIVEQKVEPQKNTETSNDPQTSDVSESQPIGKKYNPYNGLRLAPIWNNIRQILEQNNPDYTYAKQLASLYHPATYRETGQYQRYQPIDQHYLDTQVANQANTSYGFYRNNTAGNSALANLYATLVANNARAAMNDAYIKSVSENNRQRNAALAYNNQIDFANETARRQAQATNNTNWANIMRNAYTAAEEERLAVEEAAEYNKEKFAQNLGTLGKELSDMWYVNNNPALKYDSFGINYKR